MTKRLLLLLVLPIVCVLLIGTIFFFSPRRAVVRLSKSTSCEIRTNGLYHWFTDQQIPLVCSRDGNEIGRVEFIFSPEWYPIAIFPTADEHHVICYYGTDLTIALFVIELENTSGLDRSPPKGLFRSTPLIVKSTSFALRRCTKDEIAGLKYSIEAADDRMFRSWCVSGLPFVFNPGKQYVLTKIEHVSSPGKIPLAGEVPEVSDIAPK